MPEGPEIRLAADRLNTILANQTIEHAEFTLPGMQSAATRIIDVEGSLGSLSKNQV